MVGKTTLLDSIAWALYGYLPKWGGPKGGPADAVIKRGEDKCSVTVTLQNSSDLYEITRQRPVKLTVKKNGIVQEGKTSDLDKRIPEMIGMNDNQFLLCVYMPQNRTTSFFGMSDSDRTNLLSTVAGLDEMNKALDRAKAEKNAIQYEMAALSGKMLILEDNVKSFPERKIYYQDKILAAQKQHQDAIDKYNYIAGDAEREMDRLSKEASHNIQGIILTTDQEISSHDTEIRSLREKEKDLRAELISSPEVPAEFLEAVTLAKKALSEAESFNRSRYEAMRENERLQHKIKDELDMMDAAVNGRCNHCNQDLPSADRERAALRHMQNARSFETKMTKIPQEIDLEPLKSAVESSVAALNKVKSQFDERPNQIGKEISSILSKIASEEAMSNMKRSSSRREIDSIRVKSELDIGKISQILKEDQADIDSALKSIDQLKEGLSQLESREEIETQNYKQVKDEIFNAQVKLDETLDLIDLFGPKGFRTVCFEDLITRISDRAGQLFSIMTDGLYSTRIEQSGETGKGEHRVTLTPVITRGGVEVPQDDLSGGAEATATLNYDVAISEAIADNSPLFLDEALDGLDALGKSEAIRLLEEVARTRPVFLIDHTDSIKSSVQNVIQITYKNDTSVLEV